MSVSFVHNKFSSKIFKNEKFQIKNENLQNKFLTLIQHVPVSLPVYARNKNQRRARKGWRVGGYVKKCATANHPPRKLFYTTLYANVVHTFWILARNNSFFASSTSANVTPPPTFQRSVVNCDTHKFLHAHIYTKKQSLFQYTYVETRVHM